MNSDRTTSRTEEKSNLQMLYGWVGANETNFMDREPSKVKVIKSGKISCHKSFSLALKEKIARHLHEKRRSSTRMLKRACKCPCTVLPMRAHSPRTHRGCNIRTSNNKTSSKSSDTSSSDPDGASIGYFHYIKLSCVSILPIATFDNASSIEVIK